MLKYGLLITVLLSQTIAMAQSADFVHDQVQALPTARKASLKHDLAELRASLDQPLVQQAGWRDKDAPRVVVCAGIQGGMVLIEGFQFKCITSLGETFTLSSLGVGFRAGFASDVVVGLIDGAPRAGIYPLTFDAGVHAYPFHYIPLGGFFLSGGPLTLAGAGLGVEGHLSFGVPSDSLFGGQLVISTGRSE